MKLSAQEEYGLRCLLHMARVAPGGSLSIPEISRAEGLSIPNVAKLMRLLRMGGFVTSVRGQAGGYTLSRKPEEIPVGEVLELLGGSIFGPAFCQRHAGVLGECAHHDDCAVRCLWSRMQLMVEALLKKTTLRDLLRTQIEMNQWLRSGNGDGAVQDDRVTCSA